MSNVRSAEETRQAYIECMGEPLGSLFNALWQEVAFLYRRWAEYVELYGKSEARIELLNKTAPSFFRMVQDALLEQTLLHVARLTDPPKSAGRANLTIKRLPEFIKDPEVVKKISRLIEIAERSSDFCRDWRNRRIAHSDLGLALEEDIEPLKEASRKKVKDALDSIAEVLNSVDRHYRGSTTMFDFGRDLGGAESLIQVIDKGLKVKINKTDQGA